VPYIAFTSWSDVTISFPMVHCILIYIFFFFFTLSLLLLMAKWMIHEQRVLVMMELDIISWHHLLWIKYHLQFQKISKHWRIYSYKTLKMFWVLHFKNVIGFDKYTTIHPFLAHLAITWRPSSVIFSHFNLLLWNPSAKWTETWWKASMDGPL
jgi:hypothetical protein